MIETTHHSNLFYIETKQHLQIVLRIPKDTDLLCQRASWARTVDDVTQAQEVTMAASDLETADWLVIDKNCPGPGEENECECSLATLSEVATYLNNEQRAKALSAHISSMAQLDEHRLGVAFLLGVEDTGVEDMRRACVECLADPASHSFDLGEIADAKTRELLEFLTIYKTNFEVLGNKPPEITATDEVNQG